MATDERDQYLSEGGAHDLTPSAWNLVRGRIWRFILQTMLATCPWEHCRDVFYLTERDFESAMVRYRSSRELVESPTGLAYKIAGRRVADHMKRIGRPSHPLPLTDELASHSEGLNHDSVSPEFVIDLFDALTDLHTYHPEAALVFYLRHWCGFSLTEAAHMLGLSLPTASNRHRKSLAHLRRKLQNYRPRYP
jgi:DNA-directed RNA polymerase specialized sigma24 family protein